MNGPKVYSWAQCRSRMSYRVIKDFVSQVLAGFALVPTLFVLLASTANAATVAQFTGGEFYYDGTTFSTASASNTAGVSSLASITNPFGFVGSAPMTLSIAGVNRSGGWAVSSSGLTGEQLFNGGTFSLSDNSGLLMQGTINGSVLTAPTGSVQSGAIFSFNVITYSTISANLNTGLSAPLPGSYSISLDFLDNYSTPTVDTPGGLSAFNATGAGTFSAVPVPPAVWLFGTGLLGFIALARRTKASTKAS